MPGGTDAESHLVFYKLERGGLARAASLPLVRQAVEAGHRLILKRAPEAARRSRLKCRLVVPAATALLMGCSDGTGTISAPVAQGPSEALQQSSRKLLGRTGGVEVAGTWAREIGEAEWKKLPATLLAHAEQIVVETERADSLENAFREAVAFRAPSIDPSQTGRVAMARDYCTEVGIALYEASAAYRRALDAYRDTWIDIVLGLPGWDGSPGVPSPKDLHDLGAAAYHVASLKTTMIIIAGWFSAGNCFQ